MELPPGPRLRITSREATAVPVPRAALPLPRALSRRQARFVSIVHAAVAADAQALSWPASAVCPWHTCLSDAARSQLQSVVEGGWYTALHIVLLLWVLVADDLRLAFLGPAWDAPFQAVFTTGFALFCLDLVLLSALDKRYTLSFMWWLSLLTALSMLVELDWFWAALAWQGGADGAVTTAARVARAGTRAGRFVRLLRVVRLVRILRLLQLMQFVSCSRAARASGRDPHVAASSDGGNEKQAPPAPGGSLILAAPSRADVLETPTHAGSTMSGHRLASLHRTFYLSAHSSSTPRVPHTMASTVHSPHASDFSLDAETVVSVNLDSDTGDTAPASCPVQAQADVAAALAESKQEQGPAHGVPADDLHAAVWRYASQRLPAPPAPTLPAAPEPKVASSLGDAVAESIKVKVIVGVMALLLVIPLLDVSAALVGEGDLLGLFARSLAAPGSNGTALAAAFLTQVPTTAFLEVDGRVVVDRMPVLTGTVRARDLLQLHADAGGVAVHAVLDASAAGRSEALWGFLQTQVIILLLGILAGVLVRDVKAMAIRPLKRLQAALRPELPAALRHLLAVRDGRARDLGRRGAPPLPVQLMLAAVDSLRVRAWRRRGAAARLRAALAAAAAAEGGVGVLLRRLHRSFLATAATAANAAPQRGHSGHLPLGDAAEWELEPRPAVAPELAVTREITSSPRSVADIFPPSLPPG